MKRICETDVACLKELLDRSGGAGPDTGICPVDCARWIAQEAVRGTCGKGVMCRDGMKQVFLILEDIVNGKGKAEDFDLLQEILGVIAECADCELSYEASRGILTLLEKYPAEFEQHIKRKACSNLICPGCHTVHINAALCKGSGVCISVCPKNAINGGPGLFSVVLQAKCSACNRCIAVCPEHAISGAGFVKPQGPSEPAGVGSWGNTSAQDGGRRRRRRG